MAARAGAGWAGDLLGLGFVAERAGFAKARVGLFETIERVGDKVGSGPVVQGGGVIEHGEEVVGQGESDLRGAGGAFGFGLFLAGGLFHRIITSKYFDTVAVLV